MKGIVISGPTGAIGMAVIRKCISEKIPVLAICHKGSKRIANIPQSEFVNVIEKDLCDYSELFNTEKPEIEYDVFLHLSWDGTFGNSRNDVSNQINNIKYAVGAVELADRIGCRVFIGAGSQAEYGRVDSPLCPDTPAFPENGYGMAKLAAGQLTGLRCSQLGIKHIWTRILSVYGPYDGEYTMVMSTLKKMINNEPTSFTAGDQIWDYLYCDDAADIIFDLVENGEDGKIYCLGSGEKRHLKDYITEMYSATGCTAHLGLGDIPYGEKQVMCLSVDEKHVNRNVVFTPFEEGIRKTIEFIKSR